MRVLEQRRLGGSSWILLIACAPVPVLLMRLGAFALPPLAQTAAAGLAIVCAAFLLTWAAEAAERDVAGPLALGVLAIVAILPEYALDMYFAWTAGHDPAYAAYAAANMTGANRLLIGLGWALVVLLFWAKTHSRVLLLAKRHALEVGLLGAATLYSFTIPLKGELSPFDSVVLIAVFLAYLWLVARGAPEEVELVGPAAWLGGLAVRRRRPLVLALFLYSGLIIVVCAEAFGNGLVEAGTQLGIDRFLLVQWLAPLASEAPELIAVVLLSLRGRASSGLVVLLASTLNQWTLLVGGLPLAYSIGHGSPAALPLDPRQTEEFILTAAQSLFAVATLLSLSLTVLEAAVLLGLFAVGLFFPVPAVRYALVLVYVVLTAVILWRQRSAAGVVARWWQHPIRALQAPPRRAEAIASRLERHGGPNKGVGDHE